MEIKLDDLLTGKNRRFAESIDLHKGPLAFSFGIDQKNPTRPPSLEAGVKEARKFLDSIPEDFKEPEYFINIVPFANLYLGAEIFGKTIDLILKRMDEYPEEQDFADQILTMTIQISPEKRKNFLNELEKHGKINDELALLFLAGRVDPKTKFSSPGELPGEFMTSDQDKAYELLGTMVQMGRYIPGKGFTDSYYKLKKDLVSFDFVFKNPDLNTVLWVTDNRSEIKTPGLSLEKTKSFSARPENSGRYPHLVIVDKPELPEEFSFLYQQAAIIYLAKDPEKRAEMEKLLGDKKGIIVDLKDKLEDTLLAYNDFVTAGREEFGAHNLEEIIAKNLSVAEKYLHEGNERFYDIKRRFSSIGRTDLIDALIKKGGYKLPPKVDYSAIWLISDNPTQAKIYFEGMPEKFVAMRELPKESEEAPFLIFVNKALPYKQMWEKMPATIIYLADNGSQEKEMEKINRGMQVFTVNAQTIINHHGDPRYVGRYIKDLLFNNVKDAKRRGKTEMNEIIADISNSIKEVRDKLLFSPAVRSYEQMAMDYFNLQKRFRFMPKLLQNSDQALMAACPSADCLHLEEPYHGCCGHSNMPDILINFAVKYRRLVGEKEFHKQLLSYNKGEKADPWYANHSEYRAAFRDAGRRLTF